MDWIRVRMKRGFNFGHRRFRMPSDRKLSFRNGHHRFVLADQPYDRLAAKAHLPTRQHRLIFNIWKDAKAIFRHVCSAHDIHQSRMLFLQHAEIAERERRALMRRSNDAQPQRRARGLIGAIFFHARYFGDAIELRMSAADSLACGRVRRVDIALRCSKHGFDNFPIPSTTTEHAAETIQHFLLGRIGMARQQIGSRHEHAGCADATLRRTVGEKRLLQGAELTLLSQTFDRLDHTAFGLRNGGQTGTHLPSVQQHRAGAAVAGVAADLRPSKPQSVAQDIRQTRCRIAPDHAVDTIHCQLDGPLTLDDLSRFELIRLSHRPVLLGRVAPG